MTVVCAACGLCGALDPLRPWLWALCIGVWIPAYGITVTGNYGSLLALAIAFVSAYAGAGLRKILAPYATLTDRA